MTVIKLKKLHPEAQIPRRATPDSVGLDLFAFSLTEAGRPNKIIVPPRTVKMIPTGLVVEPPPNNRPNFGVELLMVCSRSGLAAKHSLFVANSPGIIDPDYRGEIKILLYNGGFETYYVQHGDRVAQLIVVPGLYTPIVEMEEVSPNTERGEAGFGSSGR